MGPMTSRAADIRLQNLMESPLIGVAPPMIRRDALAARLRRVACAMLDPSADVRNSRMGRTICCPGRIQVVAHHRPDVHIDIRIFHAGTETIRLKAGTDDGCQDEDEYDVAAAIPVLADAVAAFAEILRRMDPHGWMLSGLETDEDAPTTVRAWTDACRSAVRALKNGANVLSTIADPAMPMPVRLISSTPFTRMHATSLLDGEPMERVDRTAAAWTKPPPSLVDVCVRYDPGYTSMDVGAASTFGDGLDHLDLMRAMARLEVGGDAS